MDNDQESNDKISQENALIFFRWRNEEGWPVEYVTTTVQTLLGHSADKFRSGELIYAALIHPDDLELVTQEVVENSESGAERFEHVPYRVMHANGDYIKVQDRTSILRTTDGTVTHYLGYLSRFHGK